MARKLTRHQRARLRWWNKVVASGRAAAKRGDHFDLRDREARSKLLITRLNAKINQEG